jgi:DNA-binding MarR family transcriptional regulator
LKSKQKSHEQDFISGVARKYVEKYEWADIDAIEIIFRINAARVAMRSRNQRFYKSIHRERARSAFGVLRALYFSTPARRLSQSEIGYHMGAGYPNVTHLVNTLEQDGLVQRVAHPTDRRTTWVELTAEGEALCDTLVPAITHNLVAMTSGFSPRDRKLLRDLLVKLVKNIESYQTESA